jgi:tRNA1(Val) A37 N6-methylase TrmN6
MPKTRSPALRRDNGGAIASGQADAGKNMAGREAAEDELLGGRVRLSQSPDGYRAGMDAALLAAACDVAQRQSVVEAGCGAGAVLLMAAARRPGARFVGLERDADLVALAHANIALNGLENRVTVELLDICQLRIDREFDAALANPPFFDDPSRLRLPAAAKRGAWIAEEGLAAWIDFLTRAVKDKGTITLIHRAERLGELLPLMAARAGSFQVRPIQPHADAPASRVLVRAVRGGRAPLLLLPALVLHPRGGAPHTPEVEAILRGEADLPWHQAISIARAGNRP